MESFKFMGPALPVFCPKMPKKNNFLYLSKYLLQNVGSFSPFQKGITLFRSKISKKLIFTFYNFVLLNFHCLTYSALGVALGGTI